MALDVEVKPWYLKTLPGMNSKVEDLELQNRWVEIAQNTRFEEEPGTVTKRARLTYFNSSSKGTGAVMNLYRLYAGGVTKWIMIHGTVAYVGDDSAGTFTSIRTGLTTGKRSSFVTYKNIMIVSNGYDNPWCYDGTSSNVTWELGACKAVLTAGGSNLDSGAAYYYAVTIDADAYVCGAVSNTVTTDADNRKVTLSNIPTGPVGTTNRKIYRVEGGGSDLKLLATIADNTTTTYVDDIADGSLGAAYPAVTDDMPKGFLLQSHRERLFISGDLNNQSRIYYSNVGLPHYIQQTTNTDYMDVNPDDNDEITGIPIQLGVMCCVKKNTIRKLYITSSASTADPTTWYAEDPVSWNGCPAPWSITQTPMGIIYLGWDHWYVFNGTFSKPIIDEFDTEGILAADYNEVVSHFNNNILLAAYTDKTLATTYHNRVMRYNFKREALSYDTIDANCFGSKIGKDEKGDLFYGDSQNGYVYQAENTDIYYSLQKKSDLSAGTATDTYIGGTEDEPYLEIGGDSAPNTIPDDICILWDNESTSPGTGWVDITSTLNGKFIMFSSTAATTGGGAGHTHTFAGNLATSNVGNANAGDDNPQCIGGNHEHTITGTSATGYAQPRYIQFRIFKASSCTATAFPDGAIVMYDQDETPEGWEQVVTGIGYYIRIGATSLNSATFHSHTHTYSITSSSTNSYTNSDGGGDCANGIHNHVCSGTSSSTSLDTWELDYVSFRFIKKVGEESTWDGSSKYVYCMYAGAGTPGGDWSAVTTYNNMFLKIGNGDPATGSAANASHLHGGLAGTSAQEGQTGGNGGYHAVALTHHTHSYTMTSSSDSADTPPYYTMRLMKMLLGKMNTYNAAWISAYTSGIWVSPAMELKALTLKKLFWNETLSGTDDVVLYTRTAATSALCTQTEACTVGDAGDGDMQITDNGHGLSNLNRVVFSAATLPTGLLNDIVYYVRNKADNTFELSTTPTGTVLTYTDAGTTVVYRKWETAATDPNGSSVSSTANQWFMLLVAFTATDTTVTNPQVYFTDGFVIKMNYLRGASYAEMTRH